MLQICHIYSIRNVLLQFLQCNKFATSMLWIMAILLLNIRIKLLLLWNLILSCPILKQLVRMNPQNAQKHFVASLIPCAIDEWKKPPTDFYIDWCLSKAIALGWKPVMFAHFYLSISPGYDSAAWLQVQFQCKGSWNIYAFSWIASQNDACCISYLQEDV